MGFCNSCGRPIVKEDYGTNKDGSLNPDFCRDCYQDGEYTEPDYSEYLYWKKQSEKGESDKLLDEKVNFYNTEEYAKRI